MGIMDREARLIDTKAARDELAQEMVAQPSCEPAAGLVPERLQRRRSDRTIQ